MNPTIICKFVVDDYDEDESVTVDVSATMGSLQCSFQMIGGMDQDTDPGVMSIDDVCNVFHYGCQYLYRITITIDGHTLKESLVKFLSTELPKYEKYTWELYY